MPAKEEEEKVNAKKRAYILQPDWKDYIALAIAALETTMLPFVLLVVLLVILAFVLTSFAP